MYSVDESTELMRQAFLNFSSKNFINKLITASNP